MSAPLDVLAMMDRAQDQFYGVANNMASEAAGEHYCQLARDIHEARAAVAELVARVRPVLEWCEEIDDDDSRVPRQDMNALYAALAKFGEG